LTAPGKYRHLSEARGVAAWLILETGNVTLSALSRVTGRDVSTLSSAAKAIHVRAKSDHALEECLGKLKEVLLKKQQSKA
jgi:chromosomal replication initiation ATPase DnaA